MESPIDRVGLPRDLRSLNDSLRDNAALRERVRPSMFVCECGNPECYEPVLLDLNEYEVLRARGDYILAPGHDVSHAEHVRRVARKLREDAQALVAQAEYQQRRLRRLLGR